MRLVLIKCTEGMGKVIIIRMEENDQKLHATNYLSPKIDIPLILLFSIIKYRIPGVMIEMVTLNNRKLIFGMEYVFCYHRNI